jgi:hypothetical protein
MQILIVPGLGGSGPDHWQSHWERSYPGARRVVQSDWNRPVRSLWLEQLAAAIERMPGAMLIGHSLGCVLIADLGRRRPDLRIGGALLVAPADVDREDRVPPQVQEFAPLGRGQAVMQRTLTASFGGSKTNANVKIARRTTPKAKIITVASGPGSGSSEASALPG